MRVYFDQSTGTTLGMTNVTGIITVTYTYDDDPATNATQIKTVWIPFDSPVGALPTIAGTYSDQIPQLTAAGGLLAENSPTIRDFYFVIEGNTAVNNTTTDFAISLAVDGTIVYTSGNIENALGSDTFHRHLARPSILPDTTTSLPMELWVSTGAVTRFNHVTVTLVVTYEFNAASTTRMLNSIYIPIEISSPMGQNTTAEASRFNRRISVQETNVTLRQSAFRINFNVPASVSGLNLRAGAQSYRTYTHIGGVVCGMYSVQQRIDSGSAQGAGFTLARGFNEINIDMYTTDTTDDVSNINGYILLNYTSDVPSGGIGAANHTVMLKLLDWNAALSDINRINNYAVAIPESNYWLTGAGFVFIQWVATGSMAVTFDTECKAGEGKEAGYVDIYSDAYVSDAERACSIIWMRGRDAFKRYPQDPDTDRLDIETARDYRLYTTTTTGNGMYAILTYHSITYTVSGNVNDSNGGTVDLFLHRANTHELIGETSRTGNGSYSFTWYDNTEEVYVTAYEDDNYKDRSGSGLAA
jgi:hypothetical protein